MVVGDDITSLVNASATLYGLLLIPALVIRFVSPNARISDFLMCMMNAINFCVTVVFLMELSAVSLPYSYSMATLLATRIINYYFIFAYLRLEVKQSTSVTVWYQRYRPWVVLMGILTFGDIDGPSIFGSRILNLNFFKASLEGTSRRHFSEISFRRISQICTVFQDAPLLILTTAVWCSGTLTTTITLLALWSMLHVTVSRFMINPQRVSTSSPSSSSSSPSSPGEHNIISTRSRFDDEEEEPMKFRTIDLTSDHVEMESAYEDYSLDYLASNDSNLIMRGITDLPEEENKMTLSPPSPSSLPMFVSGSKIKPRIGCAWANCLKTYASKSSLNVHIRRDHYHLRNHQCDICGKKFAKKQNFNKHERTHSNIRPWPCDICGRRFKERQHMVNHLRTHSKLDFPCCKCEYRFPTQTALVRHQVKCLRESTVINNKKGETEEKSNEKIEVFESSLPIITEPTNPKKSDVPSEKLTSDELKDHTSQSISENDLLDVSSPSQWMDAPTSSPMLLKIEDPSSESPIDAAESVHPSSEDSSKFPAHQMNEQFQSPQPLTHDFPNAQSPVGSLMSQETSADFIQNANFIQNLPIPPCPICSQLCQSIQLFLDHMAQHTANQMQQHQQPVGSLTSSHLNLELQPALGLPDNYPMFQQNILPTVTGNSLFPQFAPTAAPVIQDPVLRFPSNTHGAFIPHGSIHAEDEEIAAGSPPPSLPAFPAPHLQEFDEPPEFDNPHDLDGFNASLNYSHAESNSGDGFMMEDNDNVDAMFFGEPALGSVRTFKMDGFGGREEFDEGVVVEDDSNEDDLF